MTSSNPFVCFEQAAFASTADPRRPKRIKSCGKAATAAAGERMST